MNEAEAVSAKEEVMTFLRNMPDDITLDEIMYGFFMLEKTQDLGRGQPQRRGAHA